MKIVGVMVAKNEEWVLRATIPAALQWVDELVFLNHASTDATRLIGAEYANETRRVTIKDWEDGEHWLEMFMRVVKFRKPGFPTATITTSISSAMTIP